MKVVNTSAPGYWEQVRKNASRRRALELVKTKFKTMHTNMVYEQYIADCYSLVKMAACREGFSGDDAEAKIFLYECAELLGLFELIELDGEEILHNAREATREAAQLLYGDEE